MISSSKRPINDMEKQQLIKQLPTVYQRFERFSMNFIAITIVVLIPFLIYDRLSPVRSNIQAIYSIVIVVVSFLITKKVIGKFDRNQLVDDISSNQVEVIRVKTTRAIERADFEDFGPAYYIEVFDNGKPKTLFLWGQYLYEYEFPNTEFEFIRLVENGELIDFKTFGQYFKEERKLVPFNIDIWKKGEYPNDGELLEISLDEIND